nr:class 1b ribonucleoside-diphosphate reductase subunit alpha [Bifidobacterium sp. DSM 109963]
MNSISNLAIEIERTAGRGAEQTAGQTDAGQTAERDTERDAGQTSYDPRHDFHALNAMLNLYDANGRIQFDKDKAAEREFMTGHVAANTMRFDSTAARLQYLIDNGYYAGKVFAQYSPEFLDAFYAEAEGGVEGGSEAGGFEFPTFLGAFKFYRSYALKTFDGKQYLENFPQRAAAVALELAAGSEQAAREYLEAIVSGRFQPATPTFLNLGKAQRGEAVSCFLLRVEDNMESISRGINAALQLSKRGGGVALLLTNLRELGAPIKHIQHQSSGVVPVMKLLEDSFSYANQLGARQGAGAVYLSAHHPDIMRFLDTKRENADEKIRIKSLSLGVVVPDITFELAKRNEQMALFSPYDVERVYGKPLADISISEHYEEMVADGRIHKSYIGAREFFMTLAELQFESGYPYIVFEDTVNRANPIDGRVTMSNLCSEILQVQEASAYNEDLTYAHVGRDVSCNLGSLNIAKAMDGGRLAGSVATAIRALTAVSEQTSMECVPSIRRANAEGHAIGLGQMNLHGFLAREGIMYGSQEALDFTDMYFMTVAYHAYRTSHELAAERGAAFVGFERSDYAKPAGRGNYFDKYTDGRRSLEPRTERVRRLFERYGVTIPSADDWRELSEAIRRDGIYNQYLQAVPPTGSISYINHSTSSIHPIVSKVEIRKEGRTGRVYYPAPYMTNENLAYYADAYEIGWQAIVDTYAEATQHVDQGLSLTLFFPDTATTRDLNKAQIYAWRKGIKTLYYIRIRQQALSGTEVQDCVSCVL